MSQSFNSPYMHDGEQSSSSHQNSCHVSAEDIISKFKALSQHFNTVDNRKSSMSCAIKMAIEAIVDDIRTSSSGNMINPSISNNNELNLFINLMNFSKYIENEFKSKNEREQQQQPPNMCESINEDEHDGSGSTFMSMNSNEFDSTTPYSGTTTSTTIKQEVLTPAKKKQKCSFKHTIEKIEGHYYRVKDGRNITYLKVKWQGFKLQRDEPVSTILVEVKHGKHELARYLMNCSTRARNTLLNRNPELMNFLNE